MRIVDAPLAFPEGCRYQVLGETALTEKLAAILRRVRPLARFAGFVDSRAALAADYLVVSDLEVPGARELVMGADDAKLIVMPLPIGDVWSYWPLADYMLDYLQPGPVPSLSDDDLLQTMIAIERVKVEPGTGKLITMGDAFLAEKTDWLAPAIDKIMAVFPHFTDQESHETYKLLLAAKPPVHWAHYIGRLFANVQYFETLNYDACQVVVNGGVFRGEELPFLAMHLPRDATVYNIDPLGHDYLTDYARRWLELGRVRFEERKVALSDKDGELTLKIDVHGQLSTRGDAENTYPASTIDSLVAREGLDRVDLIKLDLEGGDLHAVLGAQRTIMRHRPQLAISIYHYINHFWDLPHLIFQICPDYDFHLRNYSCERWETILYGVPKEVSAQRQAA